MLTKRVLSALLSALAATASCVHGAPAHASSPRAHLRDGPLGHPHGFHHNGPRAATSTDPRRPLGRGGSRGNLRHLSSREESSYSGTGASFYADWQTASCDQYSSFSLSASKSTTTSSTSGDTNGEYASLYMDIQTDCSAESTTREYISFELYGAEQPFTLTVDSDLGSASFSTTANASIGTETCTVICSTAYAYNNNNNNNNATAIAYTDDDAEDDDLAGDATAIAYTDDDAEDDDLVGDDGVISHEFCYIDNCTSVSQDSVEAVVQVTWTATDPPANSTSTNKYSDVTSSSRSSYQSQDRRAAVSFSLSLNGEEYTLPEEASLSGSVYSSSGSDVFVYH